MEHHKEKPLEEEENVFQDNDENTDNSTDQDAIMADDSQEDKKNKSKSFFGKKVPSKEIEKLKEEIESLETEKKELNEKFLRLYSEFDNYKKRTNKEKLDLISTASEKVIIAILPIIDDFERAITANEKIEDISVVKEGFELIYNKLLQLLKQFDVEEIAAKGAMFDTDLHEAITHCPAQNEEDKGRIIDVIEKGYKIKDKVIRYSKVIVGN